MTDELDGCWIVCDGCQVHRVRPNVDPLWVIQCVGCVRASMLAYGRKVEQRTAEACAEIAESETIHGSDEEKYVMWNRAMKHLAFEIRARFGGKE